MKSTVVLSAVAFLCLAITVLEAQKYCQSGSRRVLTYYRWYGWTWARYSTQYYCKYNKNPTSRPDATIRMQGEGIQSTRVYGRPEVWHSNRWGTICGRSGYGFDWRDGSVICQQLGFGGRQWNTIAASTSLVSQGSGTFWLDYLSCSSNKEWITQCSHNGWGVTGACRNHRYDVALFCRNRLKIRLTGGPTPLEGRLWYFHDTSYRKVCDDYWDIHDATVTCRQLGFGKPFSYITSTTVGTIYGRDYSSSFWLDNVHCTGDEMFLHHCNANAWGSEDCAYYEEIGINCTMPVPTLTVSSPTSSSISAKAELDYYAQFGETKPIKGFRFEYQKTGDDTWHYEVPSTSSNSYTYTITGLEPYTEYNIKTSMILTGAEQLRSFSDPQTLTTKQARPGPLTGFWFQVLSSSQIRVYWTDVPEPNGVVTKYVFQYWAKDPTWDHHRGTKYQNNRNAKSYTLTGLNAYTTYTINGRAINGAGWGENTRIIAQTQEAAPNAPPQNVKLEVHDHDSVTVSWQLPAPINLRGAISQNNVNYKWTGITGQPVWKFIAGDLQTLTINNLPPYTLFQARVRCSTGGGWGPFTPWYTVRTDEDAPGEAPQGVAIRAISSNILEVSWSLPSADQQNGIIRKYSVQFGQDMNTLRTVNVNAPTLTYKILNADPHTMYYARVAASTSAGMGPYSEFVNDKTFEAAPEGPPRDVDISDVTSSSLKVTWMIPVEEDHNGVISGYVVELGETDSGLVLADVVVAGSELDHTFIGLTPYKQYFARVAATTSAGQGPFSAQEIARLLADVPGAAPEITALVADQTKPSVTVTWEALDMMFHYDASLSGYKIHYISADPTASNAEGIEMASAQSTSYTINLLNEGMAYTISVAAYNSEGDGPYSRGKPVITSGQPPDDSPRNVRVWAVSSTKLHVEWDPPSTQDHQLTVTEYIVQYNEVGDNTTIQMTLDAETPDNRHSYDITNLSPYRYYIIIVHATNDAGDSPGSLPHTIRTLSDSPPVAPMLTNTMANATEVRLIWSVVSDYDALGIVTGYDVVYTAIATGTSREVFIAGHVYYHDFPGLDPYSEYQFRVAARNVNGTGPFSNTVNVKTLESISSPPRLLRAEAMSPTSIHLTWQPPSSPNGDIIYILNYTSLHSDIVDTEVFTLPKFYVEYDVYNLEEHVEYEFIMFARTTAGDSELVIAQEMTLEAPPSDAPEFVYVMAAGPYSLNVTWTEPPIIHHNSPLTGYKITYNLDGGNEMDIDITDTTSLYYVIDNLIPYMAYDVKVAALNDVGIGPFSDLYSTYTNKTLPPVAEVKMFSNASDMLTVYWDTPMYPNGVLQGYVLTVQAVYPPDVDDEVMTYNPSVLDTSVTLFELHPGTNYTAKLWVVNDVGQSEQSFKWMNTLSELPTASPYVMAMPYGNSSTSLYVSWSPPNTTEWNGMIKEMVLSYAKDGENVTDADFTMMPIVFESLVYPEDLTDSIVIDNLDPYTLYQFKMALVNDAGMGPYSDMAYAITNEDVPDECLNFTLRVFNNNFNMTWNPPNVINGVLRGYVFYLNGEQYVRLGIENFTLYMQDLKAHNNYVVELRAFTSIGEGKPVRIAAQTGERPFVTDALESTPQYLWYVTAACILVCVLGVITVIVLGATAYKRHQKVKALKAKSGFASDDWTLYDHYEDNAFVDEKEGFQVQENPYVHHQKDVKMKKVLTGIQGLKVGKEEVTEDDIANFEEAMDQLGHFDFDDDDTKPLN